ncbi:cupin [Corynebacterium sp. L4756]|uniref:cupin n=1 Tax=unclassified Corynebacterium TaxID=2624378 RepID=UPI00374CF9EC
MSDALNSVNLDSLIDELMEKAASVSSGRATHPFRAVPGGSLTQVLLILKEGKELSEHENPGQALLHVLRGRVKLTAAEDSLELGANDHAVVPQQRHGLTALEDSAVLLTVVHSH